MKITGSYNINQNYKQSFGFNLRPSGTGRIISFNITLEKQIAELQKLIEKETDPKKLAEYRIALKDKGDALEAKKSQIR